MKPEEGWQCRTVLLNTQLRHSARLWSQLGVDLYIVKVCTPLDLRLLTSGPRTQALDHWP